MKRILTSSELDVIDKEFKSLPDIHSMLSWLDENRPYIINKAAQIRGLTPFYTKKFIDRSGFELGWATLSYYDIPNPDDGFWKGMIKFGFRNEVDSASMIFNAFSKIGFSVVPTSMHNYGDPFYCYIVNVTIRVKQFPNFRPNNIALVLSDDPAAHHIRYCC
jgi:hypothetical protein